MKKVFFILLLLHFFGGILIVSAQENIENREFNEKEIEDYRSERAFNYIEEDLENPGYANIILDRVSRFLQRIFSNKATYFILNNFHYLILTIALLILIIKWRGIKLGSLFKKDESISEETFIYSVDEIESLDFNKMIKESIRKKEYKNALRFQYLKLLKLLHDQTQIKYQPYKTNHDYYYEIKQSEIKESFQKVFTTYENVWYGGFPVDDMIFNNEKEHYSQIERLLK